MIAHPGKCTQLPAQTVVERPRFRSSLTVANLFTVGTAIRETSHHGIRCGVGANLYFFFFLF